VRRAVTELALSIVTLQPFRDFEGMLTISVHASSRAPSASSM